MLGGERADWEAAGFEIEAGEFLAGTVRLRLTEGYGISGWRVQNVGAADLDGLPTEFAEPVDPPEPAAAHPNGVSQIDHVVVFTPDLERTTAAFEGAGIKRRRVREVDTDGGQLRQGFFRLSEVIVEVVEHAKVPPGPARFWGITFSTGDLDAAAERLGDKLGTVRDAVQPGRRIATIRKEAGLGLPVALISEATHGREVRL